MAIDKKLAQQLRLEGKSLQEVADTLGCSLGWCKANLKGVKQPNKDKALIESIRQLGRSENGVTTGEIKMLTSNHYPALKGDDLETKVTNIKRSARKGHSDVVVRPYWMLPNKPRDCTVAMLEYANEVYNFKEYLADKYREQFDLDETYSKTVVYALTMMSAGEHNKLMPQGLANYGATLERIQDALDSRNNPQHVKQCQTAQPNTKHTEPAIPDHINFDYMDGTRLQDVLDLESIDFIL